MLDNNNLQDIFQSAKQGDKASEELFFHYLHVRFSLIAKYRLQESYLEDITQDACLTVLEKYKDLSPDVNIEAWAYQVLRNKIGNHLKNSKLRDAKLYYSDDIDSLSSRESEENGILLKTKIMACLKKLGSYNPDYLTILDMRNQGFTTSEICQKMNITANNLYVMLYRSRSLLYDCLYKSKEKS